MQSPCPDCNTSAVPLASLRVRASVGEKLKWYRFLRSVPQVHQASFKDEYLQTAPAHPPYFISLRRHTASSRTRAPFTGGMERGACTHHAVSLSWTCSAEGRCWGSLWQHSWIRLATSDWQSIPGTSKASCSLIWYGCGISPVTISRIRTPRLKMSIYTVHRDMAEPSAKPLYNAGVYPWSF